MLPMRPSNQDIELHLQKKKYEMEVTTRNQVAAVLTPVPIHILRWCGVVRFLANNKKAREGSSGPDRVRECGVRGPFYGVPKSTMLCAASCSVIFRYSQRPFTLRRIRSYLSIVPSINFTFRIF